MALAPSEFYALTYCELVLICEGHAARNRRELIARREESAWAVSWLLLPHKGADADPITPDQLMGKGVKGKGKDFANDEDKARALVKAFRAKSEKRKRDGK